MGRGQALSKLGNASFHPPSFWWLARGPWNSTAPAAQPVSVLTVMF